MSIYETGEMVELSENIPMPDPCPFCGDKGEHGWEAKFCGGGPPPGFSIVCGNCGAEGPMGTGWDRDDFMGAREAAVKMWNDRHVPETIGAGDSDPANDSSNPSG